MPRSACASTRHTIRDEGDGLYRIAWIVSVKPTGCRYRIERAVSRITDRAGARRFQRRWDVRDVPPSLQ